MKKKLLIVVVSVCYILGIVGCSKKDDGIACTEEFRSVTITVNGGVLDEYFTIRQSTGDTISIDKDTIMGQNIYFVLNDNFQQAIENKTEDFRFKGFINDTLVVEELFKIKADACHIEYVSGKTVINL